jgi:hypothetical protein
VIVATLVALPAATAVPETVNVATPPGGASILPDTTFPTTLPAQVAPPDPPQVTVLARTVDGMGSTSAAVPGYGPVFVTVMVYVTGSLTTYDALSDTFCCWKKGPQPGSCIDVAPRSEPPAFAIGVVGSAAVDGPAGSASIDLRIPSGPAE